MVVRLNANAAGFSAEFAKLIRDDQQAIPVQKTVFDILEMVRAKGDIALIELTEKFDHLSLSPETLRFDEAEIKDIAAKTPDDIFKALKFAHGRIKSHHQKQKPKDHIYTDDADVTLGVRWTPVDAVGIYVPGGLASYPSSVLMNAVPAHVAGVKRIAMVVPTPKGQVNPAILSAAQIAGVTEIYRVGGAQAVGALAYGTATIKPVDKIVGPGNAYVAEAKRQVFGTVGIDMIAGPSEVLVICDQSANPAWVAADLLAQIEHGAGAKAIALVLDEAMAVALENEVDRQIKTLSRAKIARDGWERLGAIIQVSDLGRAVELANIMAPEHLELAVDNPGELVPLIRHAGAIFMGHHTPEAIGDYVGGSNHVLPTSRTARFASGLGTIDFMKRTSLLGCTPGALVALGSATVTIANAEELEAHGRSVSIRLNR